MSTEKGRQPIVSTQTIDADTNAKPPPPASLLRPSWNVPQVLRKVAFAQNRVYSGHLRRLNTLQDQLISLVEAGFVGYVCFERTILEAGDYVVDVVDGAADIDCDRARAPVVVALVPSDAAPDASALHGLVAPGVLAPMHEVPPTFGRRRAFSASRYYATRALCGRRCRSSPPPRSIALR